MSIFKVSDNLILKEKPTDLILFEGETWSTIPVTRYSQGMSRSLYYQENNNKFCGTFYYLEKESTTFLLYQKALKTTNKLEAFLKLMEQVDDNEKSKWEKNKQDVEFLLEEPWYRGEINDNYIIQKGPYFIYGGRNVYAREDSLDQAICQLAKIVGYDIIILEKMPGWFQVVTEILDVRERGTSFRHLAFLTN